MNNLIYFTIACNKKYIDLLRLCIQSLYSQNYTGDILIITTNDFKADILSSISFNREPLFLISSSNSIGDSSFSKLKIYQYENISNYDKIIYCDCDILWVDNPEVIFDSIDDDKIYAANETELMAHEYWGGSVFDESEKKYIIQHKIFGVNAGFFAFRKSALTLIESLHNYCLDNYNHMNACLEQPLFNVFLYRNRCYKILKKEFIAFNQYKENCVLIHFLGGPGDYISKIEKMNHFIRTHLKTRTEILSLVPRHSIIGEIGVFRAEFSKQIFEITNPKELHLFDLFTGNMVSGDKDGRNVISIDLDKEYERIKAHFISYDNVFLHKGTSQETLSKFEDNYFDMLYIDGDHTYNGVSSDLEMSIKKVKKNGYICGHDYHAYLFNGVYQAVTDFCNKYKLAIEFVTMDRLPSFVIRKNYG